jgi:asparagine synthetase B (glutamine-hydrolysing)
MSTTSHAIDHLDAALRNATRRERPDALLLSGGLDSSLLAALWARSGHRPMTLTVGLHPSIICPLHDEATLPCNQDLSYAGRVAAGCGLDWEPLALTIDEALDVLDALLVQQRSFDLGQLNNIPLLAGIRAGLSRGAASFATGDDGDGLFGGYRFLRDQHDWSPYVTERLQLIDPPARSIGQSLGCAPIFPYLAPEVTAIASGLARTDVFAMLPLEGPPSFVDQFDAALMAAPERPWGKVILRRVAERWLQQEIAWRPKTDLQFGSGMCALEPVLAGHITEAVRKELDATGIAWFNDAHRGLYQRFRDLGLTVPAPSVGEYACRSCGGGVPVGKRHCVTCGCWPADRDAS